MTRRAPPRPLDLAEAPTPDAELMARLARGEIDALGELYDRHQAAVRRFLTRTTEGAAEVDDLVHVTFLTSAKSASRYDGRSSCRPWLMGIAVQLLRQRRHALGRWLSVLGSLSVLRQPSSDPRGELSTRTDIERALSRLSEAKRTTVLLSEVEGMTGPEIAAALGIPVGTVWTRLHAARRELRRALAEREDP